jgi:hypothetical protein
VPKWPSDHKGWIFVSAFQTVRGDEKAGFADLLALPAGSGSGEKPALQLSDRPGAAVVRISATDRARGRQVKVGPDLHEALGGE